MTAKKTMTQAERDELQIRISDLAPGEGVANSNPYGGLVPGVKQPPAWKTGCKGGVMKFTPIIIEAHQKDFLVVMPGAWDTRIQNLNETDYLIMVSREHLRPLADALLEAEKEVTEYWVEKKKPA